MIITSYEFTPSAEGQLRKLPASIQRQIIRKIEHFINTPDPLYFAEPLVGKDKTYRFRIWDYRAIFELRGSVLLIIKIGHRSAIYR